MIRLASILGLLSCCMMLSTCGTARAIADDYEDDYIIRNIRPLSAVSGEEATFQADLCFNSGARITEDLPSFTWDFGGGAEPNVSFESEPTVTIRDGIRAPYECTLTMRGGCLEEDEISATFTLNVEPLSVIAVTPTTGQGGSTALFTAVIGSGNVTNYAWDFGGACSPNGSNLIHPNVTFTQTAGVYNARVLVSNNFEVYEFPFSITVTPGPAVPAE